MGCFEHLIDFTQWMFLDELTDLDAAAHDEFQGVGIKIGRASPITDRPRVVRH